MRTFLIFLMLVSACFSSACQQPSPAAVSRTAPIEDSQLAPYFDLLKHPEKAWSGRKDPEHSLDFTQAPQVSPDLAKRRLMLESILQTYAPRIWIHPAESFPPMDPLMFLKNSSLWRKHTWTHNERIAARGQIKSSELAHLSPDISKDYYLKFEAPNSEQPKAQVPVFWKVDFTSAPFVLIEYWYHLPFSFATRVGIGNHQGDWEGLAALVEITPRMSHRLIATYYAAHNGGHWHCRSELEWTPNSHPEAYSAVGSHATYPSAGEFHSSVITDYTARGRPWESWKNVRPLALEPYFGFAGSWGDTNLFSFMAGPRVPRTLAKTLPQSLPENITVYLSKVRSQCDK